MKKLTVNKSPSEIRAVAIDVRRALLSGGSISTVSWTKDTGLTIDSEATVGTKAIALISGGSEGRAYHVKGAVTTSEGQVLEGYFKIEVDTVPTLS